MILISDILLVGGQISSITERPQNCGYISHHVVALSPHDVGVIELLCGAYHPVAVDLGLAVVDEPINRLIEEEQALALQ